MDPSATSKIIKFLSSKLRTEFENLDILHNYDKELNNLLQRGENYVKSNRVRLFSREEEGKLIGMIDPSYGTTKLKTAGSSKAYHTEVTFTEEEGPTFSSCECPVGAYICSHVVALLLFAQKMFSRTDFGSVWSRPKQDGTLNKPPINDIWHKKNSSTNRIVPETSILADLADQNHQFGLYWILNNNNIPVNICPDFGYSSWETTMNQMPPSLSLHDKIQFVMDKQILTDEEIKIISNSTIGQAKNQIWLRIWKYKITASRFGKIIKAMMKKKKNLNYQLPKSLYENFFNQHDISQVKSIKYGIDHEDDGISYYENVQKRKVHRTGIIFHSCGFIGGSPDGIVSDEEIIEVKCAFSLRNTDFEEALQSKYCILTTSTTGELKLKEDHDYYHQIQGLLHLTKRKRFTLVYWTHKWQKLIPVTLDLEWKENIQLLKEFYTEYLLTFLFST